MCLKEWLSPTKKKKKRKIDEWDSNRGPSSLQSSITSTAPWLHMIENRLINLLAIFCYNGR